MRPGLVRFIKGDVQVGPTVYVEIVSTPDEMARGLMGRTSLAQDCGMLFQFSWRGEHLFYMRQTYLPLDLIWIDGQSVVGGLTMIPLDETSRGIGKPSTTVLEVNGGFCRRHGITVGQQVTVTLT